MSKKGKSRRKDAYKSILAGFTTYRNRFIERKFVLAEKVLSDVALKEKLVAKGKDLSSIERAVLCMLKDREIETVEQLKEISESVKEAQIKTAKFKYTPKKI